jgi:hypothetical protein
MIKSTLGMIHFFFIAVPVFLFVYSFAMIAVEIKYYLSKLK